MTTRQGYDGTNWLAYQGWQFGSTAYSEKFTYDSTQDGTLNKHFTATGETLTMGYDGLRRLSTVTGGTYKKTYTYRDISSTQTTTQVASVFYDLVTDRTFSYTYDNMGNIATYTDENGTVTYTYDNQGQLTKAIIGNTTYNYSYDTVGNVLSNGRHSFEYGNTDWRDLLTKVDNHTISYDSIGNPTSYYNGTSWTFTWSNGRQLTTASGDGHTISYAYDADGLRTSKTVDGVEHTYYYAGGKLLRETYGNNTLDFFYDASGTPYALNHNGTTYYYVTNLQGDVMNIVNSVNATMATYNYDPYGNVIKASGELADINPLRYRGYYYDTESKLYYLQSRYYDPEIGRFLNADSFASTGQGILGNNMFAYCGNNPVYRRDDVGTYYTPGQIHNFVVKDICDNNPNKTGDDSYITYYEPVFRGRKWYTYGFCDVYDTETHEVWEVKRLGGGPTCSPIAAGEQLANYVVRGFLKHHDTWQLKLGGTETFIEPNVFTKMDNDGRGMYVIGYFDAGNGLVFYDYFYIPSAGEAVSTVCAVVGIYALFSGAGFAAIGAVPGLLGS